MGKVFHKILVTAEYFYGFKDVPGGELSVIVFWFEAFFGINKESDRL